MLNLSLAIAPPRFGREALQFLDQLHRAVRETDLSDPYRWFVLIERSEQAAIAAIRGDVRYRKEEQFIARILSLMCDAKTILTPFEVFNHLAADERTEGSFDLEAFQAAMHRIFEMIDDLPCIRIPPLGGREAWKKRVAGNKPELPEEFKALSREPSPEQIAEYCED
jgi:hypothetical protein